MFNPLERNAQVFGDDGWMNGSCMDGWRIVETDFHPANQHYRETLFNLSNGYLGTRGSLEEGLTHDCPATLLNGLYDDVAVFTTELINLPNWLPLTIEVDGDEFSLEQGTVLTYERELNLRIGVINRFVRWCSPKGHTLEFNFGRFLSLADQHVGAINLEITSIDFAGEIRITAGFHPEPKTQQVSHWYVLQQGHINRTNGDKSCEDKIGDSGENMVWLHNQTHHTQIHLGMAATLRVQNIQTNQQMPTTCIKRNVGDLLTPMLQVSCDCVPGAKLRVEKIVSIFTSNDRENPVTSAQQHLEEIPSYQTLLAAHIASWSEAWQRSDIYIEGDGIAQLGVRYSLFQLLAVAPRHNEHVSIPPKTLSGFVYRGHIFWDTEIFILPLFTYTHPHLAKNLLSYRYHTLAGARRKAQEAGYSGAMYAWESAGTGDEVTPRWVENAEGEKIRIWCGDIEVHISADIAYGVWQYWQTTGDDVWMRDRGAEIILDTAKFWQSRVHWQPETHSYHILDVIGPDENHDCVDNNAYTNLLVKWHLRTAQAVWSWLANEHPQAGEYLAAELGIDQQRVEQWEHIAQHLAINFDEKTGLIEQCDGFFELENVDLDEYRDRTTSMQGLLGVEATNQKQILKQPDVLMLLYLLREHFNRETLQANWDYYHPRTDHSYGSSLAPAIHAVLAADLHLPSLAYKHFYQAACVDTNNLRGNTHEGIHAATAGSVWQAVVFGFAGIRLTPIGPVACPNLPAHWQRLKFRLQWQNQWYEFDLSHEHTNVECAANPVDFVDKGDNKQVASRKSQVADNEIRP